VIDYFTKWSYYVSINQCSKAPDTVETNVVHSRQSFIVQYIVANYSLKLQSYCEQQHDADGTAKSALERRACRLESVRLIGS